MLIKCGVVLESQDMFDYKGCLSNHHKFGLYKIDVCCATWQAWGCKCVFSYYLYVIRSNSNNEFNL